VDGGAEFLAVLHPDDERTSGQGAEVDADHVPVGVFMTRGTHAEAVL
jgi:hypothetical protein